VEAGGVERLTDPKLKSSLCLPQKQGFDVQIVHHFTLNRKNIKPLTIIDSGWSYCRYETHLPCNSPSHSSLPS